MATNPMTPPTPPGGGGGGGGGDNSNLNNQLNLILDINKAIENGRKILDSYPKHVDEISKKFEKARTEMKGMVILADSAQDAFKGMADVSKSLTKTLATGGGKGLKDLKATMQAIVEAGQEAMDRGILSPKEMKAQQRIITETTRKLESLKDVTDEAFAVSGEQTAYIRYLKDVGKEFEKMGTAAGRAKIGFGKGGFQQGVVGVRRNLIEAGLMKAGKVEKYAAYGEAAVKLKDAARAKRQDQQDEFRKKRDEAREKVSSIMGLAPGELNLEKIRTRKQRREAAAQMPGGASAENLKMLQEASGTKPGIMSKLLGGGMIENAMGSAAEFVGQAAVPLAIAEAIKDVVVSLIDKNAEMNKQAESLAGGGLLTGFGAGAPSGADALLAARANLSLRPSEPFSRLGLGYDRNIKMAQAMMESGYNIEKVGEGGPTGLSRPTEFGPGVFGEVQEIAATQGRVLGMGDAQSIQLTMKLLMQYRESMEGTSSFFTNLTKDSRAAGISATKYVSILEEILGHFDRMNKSLDQVTGTMRTLSRTGRSTAEDLQATMGMLTGADRQPMDLAATAYVAMQMKGTPGTMQRIAGQGQQNVDAAAANVAEALKGLGIENYDQKKVAEKLMSPGGRDEIRGLIDSAKATGKFDVQKIINANAAVEGASSAARGLDYTKRFMQGKMSAVDYGASMLSKGMGPQEQENFRRQAMETMLQKSGYSIKDITEDRPVSAKLKLMLEQALPGFKAEDVSTYGKALRDTASARFDIAANPDEFIEPSTDKAQNDAAKKAYEATNQKRAQAFAEEVAKVVPELAGDFKAVGMLPKDKQDYIGLMKMWERNPSAHAKILSAMATQTSTQNELMNTQSDTNKKLDKTQEVARKAAIDEKARSTGAVTQNTAEIFANAFGTYFNQIIGLLEKIRTFFAHSRYFGGVSEGQETQGKQMVDDMKDAVETAMAANTVRIESLTERLRNPDLKPGEKASLQAQLDDEKKKRIDLESGSKFGAGSGYSQYDAANIARIAKGEVENMNEPIQDAMKSLGVMADKSDTYTLTPEQYKQQADLIGAAAAAHVVEVQQGKNAQGGDTYTVHVTNNSASINLKTNQLQSTAMSVESAQDQGGYVK